MVEEKKNDVFETVTQTIIQEKPVNKSIEVRKVVVIALSFAVLLFVAILVLTQQPSISTKPPEQTPAPQATITPTESIVKKSEEIINTAKPDNVTFKKLTFVESEVEITYPTNFNVTKNVDVALAGEAEVVHYDFVSFNKSIVIRMSNAIESLDGYETERVTDDAITISPLQYNILGKAVNSVFMYFGEGVPCNEVEDGKLSSFYLTQHLWAVDNQIMIKLDEVTYQNECLPAESYSPTESDKAFAKRIVESVKIIAK